MKYCIFLKKMPKYLYINFQIWFPKYNFKNNKPEHVQTSKPRVNAIILITIKLIVPHAKK